MIPVIISSTIFTVVLLFSLFRYSGIDSVSSIYYKFPEKHRRMFFWLWFILFSSPLLILAQSGLLVLAVGGLWFVATAAAYRESGMTPTVHYVGAGVSILSLMLYIGFTFGAWWLVAIFFAGSFLITYLRPFATTLYIELLAIYIGFLSLLIF